MALIIQKFGGTSVADERARGFLLDKVQGAVARGDKVVVVVSAMGRRGAPYATDTLLDLLKGIAASPDPLTLDLAASCGEVISACMVSTLLEARGVKAVPLTAYTAGIEAEGPYLDATPTGMDSEGVAARLAAGVTPVITGFQGVLAGGELVTLGRGGSDTTAVAVGVGLGADYVDIYTDVPGVAKADPRVVKDAPFMEYLDYDSMFRLANHGARVLHDRSARIAERGGALVRVRSTFDDGEGTLIGPATPPTRAGKAYAVPGFVGIASLAQGEGSTRVTAVFSKGKGGAGLAKASAAAAAEGARAFAVDDPDAAAFLCPSDKAGRLANALFSALA